MPDFFNFAAFRRILFDTHFDAETFLQSETFGSLKKPLPRRTPKGRPL